MSKRDKQYHRRSDGAVVEPFQQKHMTFHWRTGLTTNRMEEIDAWLATLTPDQLVMIRDIRSDGYEQGYEDARG